MWHCSSPICYSTLGCIRSGVTRYTLLIVLYLYHMCQCGLHAVLWLHISILMRHLAAEPRCSKGMLFPSQCPSGTIMLTHYSKVWYDGFQEQGKYFITGLSCSSPTIGFYYFHFLFILSVGWYCRAGVIVLIGCISLSLSLALSTSLNNNNNNNNNFEGTVPMWDQKKKPRVG